MKHLFLKSIPYKCKLIDCFDGSDFVKLKFKCSNIDYVIKVKNMMSLEYGIGCNHCLPSDFSYKNFKWRGGQIKLGILLLDLIDLGFANILYLGSGTSKSYITNKLIERFKNVISFVLVDEHPYKTTGVMSYDGFLEDETLNEIMDMCVSSFTYGKILILSDIRISHKDKISAFTNRANEMKMENDLIKRLHFQMFSSYSTCEVFSLLKYNYSVGLVELHTGNHIQQYFNQGELRVLTQFNEDPVVIDWSEIEAKLMVRQTINQFDSDDDGICRSCSKFIKLNDTLSI